MVTLKAKNKQAVIYEWAGGRGFCTGLGVMLFIVNDAGRKSTGDWSA